jgi:hypothetical protein
MNLGRLELGAIAIVRTACCPNAPAFTAKVAAPKCGSLVEILVALGKQPSAENAQRYSEAMACLAERKVWFPEGWSRVRYKQSQQSFDEFLKAARDRSARAR